MAPLIVAIIDFMKPYCETLHDYTSGWIRVPQLPHILTTALQNSIIAILAELIIDELRAEFGQAHFISVLADETKDLSKKEQLSIVIRYLYECEIHEEFVGFTVAETLDAESLSQYILQRLSLMGVENDNIVGQGYDGASVMSGSRTGVQTRIQEVAAHAFYVHCFNHRQNLTIVDTVHSIVPVADFFSALKMIYKFVSGSAVHSKWVKFQQDQDLTLVEFKSICETRWSAQVRAVAATKKRFDTLVEFIRSIELTDSNRERATGAKSLLGLLDQTFIYTMLLMFDLLNETKLASDSLQDPEIDYCKAADLIEALMDEVKSYTETSGKAKNYFSQSLDIARKNKLPCVGDRERRLSVFPARMDDYFIQSSVGKRSVVSSWKDMNESVLKPTIVNIVGELERRFSHGNLAMFRAMASLDPNSDKFLDFDTAKPLIDAYALNSDDLELEMRHLKRMISRGITGEMDTIIELYEYITPMHMAFYEIKNCCKSL